MSKDKWNWCVWVGGVDDYYVHYKDAKRDYDDWITKDYDDVILERIDEKIYNIHTR